MTVFKRKQRAAAKRKVGRGRHARPAIDAVMSAPRWPQVADVPPELASAEYEFPRVQLPASRPGVGRQVLAELAATDDELLPWEQELLANAVEPSPEAEAERAAYVRRLERSIAAVADDDTAPIDLTTMVVDPTPQPAHAECLTPVPVPSAPFLNAGAAIPDMHGELENLRLPGPDPVLVARTQERLDRLYRDDPNPEPDDEPGPVRPYVTVGNALPARLTAWELELLHRPVGEILGDPDEMPTTALPVVREPQVPLPPQRDEQHQLVFSVFDARFWGELNDAARRAESAAADVQVAYEERQRSLEGRLARLDAAHRAAVRDHGGHEYGHQLAQWREDTGTISRITAPLPHRVPGAALAAIEAAEPVAA